MALKLIHLYGGRAGRTHPESTPLGINLVLGTAVMTFACLSIGAATSAETARLAVVAVALGCFAVAIDEVVPVLLLLPMTYLFFDGFLLNNMGRLTWDSLPARFRPLPGRRNIVVTRNAGWSAAGALPAASLDAALALAGDAPRVFVIGGASLYAAALPRADELWLTEIERDFNGETRFPPWPRDSFVEASRERHVAAAPNDFAFSFVVYRRAGAPDRSAAAAGSG